MLFKNSVKKLSIVLLINNIQAHSLKNPTHSFVCRQGFEEISDFICQPHRCFDPKKVKPGDIIFVDNRMRSHFFLKIHSLIPNPYVLIMHVWDLGSPDKYINYLQDPKIIAWFGIHPTIPFHPKFFPIPIGVLQFSTLYQNKVSVNTFFTKLRTEIVKEKWLYMNFCINTNKSARLPVYNLFKNKSFCFTQNKKLKFGEYMAEMAQFRFVLSPRGNASDCYRTWEALLVGCIPIVKSSYLDSLYQDLPVLIVKDWHEINENFLKKKYVEFIKKEFNYNKLYMEYWLKKINLIKNKDS